MTAAQDLIQEGFREGNLIPVGTTPTTAEQTEALGVLNRYLDGLYGFVIGENLFDWAVPQDQRTGTVAANYPQYPGSRGSRYPFNFAYPPSNVRLIWDGSARTVYFPDSPDDGARIEMVKASGAAATGSGVLTLDGNGRTIEGANTYTTDGSVTRRRWLYRADLADWVALQTLQLTDECPFPPAFDDYWTTGLAIRLAARYGKRPAAETVGTYRRMWATIRAQYQQHTPGVFGGSQLINSDQPYGENDWYDQV